ncbi:carboxymuconolactone decarboxylase family protein [Gryllotalpicola sp.]|uniref:carboxymuconolactone decarboxylase family protein n=1 Tax=Gryllotalpicola sp. TaxID=1932787 RepID=UPI0026039AA8|nr:carboxymuconolactone decarboxylase family protein [Gryllotalpicola sp.]
MADYFDTDDKKFTHVYRDNTPDILKVWGDFNTAIFQEGREIPVKYRELAAIAVALTTQCPYCIEGHTAAAKKAGANENEIAEIAWVATALRAGAAYTHGRLAFKLYEGAPEAHQH